ncbi:MAG TPA: hypothetical protein VKY92_15290, partial [Verrucomicrobiae bacterium]|nr:hypothetical protein [Verrucomicrobiae bacterium]
LSVLNLPIVNWQPGAALWLVWQMTDPAGKAQGLAIDNLSFSAASGSTPLPLPLSFQSSSTNLTLTWTGVTGQSYQLEYKDDLSSTTWLPLGNPITGTGAALSISADFSLSTQRFYRLHVIH